MRGRGRTWGRHGWPGWSAIAVRRFGRSCVATAARGDGVRPRSATAAATSGQSQARCCTSTPSSFRSLRSPDTGRTAIAAASRKTGVRHAYSSRTSWSTITLGWPMSRSTPTTAVRSPARCSAVPRRGCRERMRTRPGGHDRQRVRLHQSQASAMPSPNSKHAASDPSRTPRWNGKPSGSSGPSTRNRRTARLGDIDPTQPSPVIVPALLQPAKAPHLTRRPATHQPRSPRPRAGRLRRVVRGSHCPRHGIRIPSVRAVRPHTWAPRRRVRHERGPH